MKTISRYLMTLVALFAMTTGAWADEATITLKCGTTKKTFEKAELPWSTTADILKEVISDYKNVASNIDAITGGDCKVVKYGNEQFTVTGTFSGEATVVVSWYNSSKQSATITVTAPGPLLTLNDTKTEATMESMPTSDVTIDYELVRDMQDATKPVAFTGLPTTTTDPIIVKKGDNGKYQPAEELNIQLIDPLAAAEAQDIIAADGITVKVLVGAENGQGAIDYDQENPITLEAFLADMKPGYYWIKAEPTDENSPYDGTVYSSEFTVEEKYDLTVKPANDFSKGKIESVTVGTESVTIDATTGEATKTGIAPETEVKIKAKRGYVIDKVDVKKGIVKLLTLNIGGDCPGTITYAEGETWGQAIENHPTENAGWTIGSLSGYILYDDTGVWLGGDRVKKEDAINPNSSYYTE